MLRYETYDLDTGDELTGTIIFFNKRKEKLFGAKNRSKEGWMFIIVSMTIKRKLIKLIINNFTLLPTGFAGLCE